LVLVTDGANNRGQLDPLVAAEAAEALGIRIYTIGVGRSGMVPFPVRLERDGTPVRARDGSVLLRPQPSDIDLETLQTIAEITGGRYFHATDLQGLRDIYAEIDRMEKTEVEMDVRRLYNDVFAIPLALALALLALETAWQLTRARRLPA
jgi:Ca-activated chloride channel family protein